VRGGRFRLLYSPAVGLFNIGPHASRTVHRRPAGSNGDPRAGPSRRVLFHSDNDCQLTRNEYDLLCTNFSMFKLRKL
jgi:hypothetical protein